MLQAHALYRLAGDASFFDALREAVRTSDAFVDGTPDELAERLAPLEQETRAIADLLGERHTEREALRARLRDLEPSEAA